jgi:hypothetical protein
MPLTIPYNTKLKQSITAHDTTLRVTVGRPDICNRLNTPPSHMFATIYTASRNEVVVITDCDGDEFIVQRGVDGTSAQAWPINACLRITDVVDCTVCEDLEDTGCAKWWEAITVGKGLRIDMTNPDAPILEVAATGVSVGSMCGAEINDCGQFTFVPENWPASCLPTFNPCCDNTTSGGGTTGDACDIAYTPRPLTTIIQSSNVCGALEDLEDAIINASGGSGGVEELTAGDCIAISGSTTNPVISVADSGITPGDYAGFTVNACGMITAYTPVPPVELSIVGLGSINATYNVTGEQWEVSIQEATTEVCGCVIVADEAEAANATPNLTGSEVITWDFLQLYLQTKGLI